MKGLPAGLVGQDLSQISLWAVSWPAAGPAGVTACDSVLFSPPRTSDPRAFLIDVLFLPSLLSVQLEAFYSIFTTEQQDHVKSVEYLRNNFRPQQGLNGRVVSKSAVRDAWNHDLTDFLENPLGTEASKGTSGYSARVPRKIPYRKLLRIQESCLLKRLVQMISR